MHIGVDATCWGNLRGYGRHARALLNAMIRVNSGDRYTLLLDEPSTAGQLPDGAEYCLVRNSRPTAVAASSNGSRSPRDLWRMSRAMSALDCQVLLFPTVYSYVPVAGRARKVVIVHDVIAERYPRLTLPALRSRILWKAKAALGRRQADAVVTVSEYSRQGILQQFRLPAERVHVVGEASDPVFRVLENPQLPERLRALGVQPGAQYVVYVGGFGPHKNVGALVAAFARGVHDAQLLLVGEYRREVFHSEAHALVEQARESGAAGRIVFTGYLSDEELVALLNLSSVLVLPSLMEGFGLPAMEAAACGCPVIATRESPLPALLGDAALFFDPHDQPALEAALGEVLACEATRRRMREQGLAAARRFTWEAAARQMIGVLHKVVAQ